MQLKVTLPKIVKLETLFCSRMTISSRRPKDSLQGQISVEDNKCRSRGHGDSRPKLRYFDI
jgi:hypothetical protein